MRPLTGGVDLFHGSVVGEAVCRSCYNMLEYYGGGVFE